MKATLIKASTTDFDQVYEIPVYQTGIYPALKGVSDYFLALIIPLILSPFLLILSAFIALTGKGPVIYTQDRIGKSGKPFVIYKFRSMIFDAENGGPMLSGFKEERVTKLGRFMRKYRIDEIPNFLNVLKGEMSIVGPRPERKFYIDQIIKKAPEYSLVHSVKPGITSWGQIKFGYASSVEEMVERFEYDLFYLKHRSAWFDLKIILLTLLTILKGKGY
jgi:lipopolysaccharide/colanic/teichoic acid biosynthesis glycosyltransferase